MGLLSKLMGWDATQQQLDHMAEEGHRVWAEQQEKDDLSYPPIESVCWKCNAIVDPNEDKFCGQCGTQLW